MPPKQRQRKGAEVEKLMRELATLRTELHGCVITTRQPNPPVVKLRPYYPLVITLDGAAAGSALFIKPSTIADRIVSQLGLPANTSAYLVFKLKEIRIWGYQYGSSSDRVALSADIGTLIPSVEDVSSAPVTASTYSILAKLQDFGSLDKPAFIGYRWPQAHQSMCLYTSVKFNIAEIACNSVSSTIHIHLLWSTADISVLPDLQII